MSDAVAAKRAIRAAVQRSRSERTPLDRDAAATGLVQQCVDLIRETGACSIAAYLSTPEEPDTRNLLAWTREHGIRVLLPIVRTDGLLDWAEFDDTEAVGAFGLPEPSGPVLPPNAIATVDLILAPAAAVDERGTRLGWGRGFFDKALGAMEDCPPVYALLFESEIIDSVPREPHDHPVDGAITPNVRVNFPRS